MLFQRHQRILLYFVFSGGYTRGSFKSMKNSSQNSVLYPDPFRHMSSYFLLLTIPLIYHSIDLKLLLKYHCTAKPTQLLFNQDVKYFFSAPRGNTSLPDDICDNFHVLGAWSYTQIANYTFFLFRFSFLFCWRKNITIELLYFRYLTNGQLYCPHDTRSKKLWRNCGRRLKNVFCMERENALYSQFR